jgi:hypothetical protein
MQRLRPGFYGNAIMNAYNPETSGKSFAPERRIRWFETTCEVTMKQAFHVVLMLSTAAPVLAASLAIWPPDATTQDSLVPLISPLAPTTNDTIVLEVPGDHPCASIIPGTVEMVAPNTIRVRYETGATLLCIAAVPQPQRIALGSFAGGLMRVESGTSGSGTGVITSFQFVGQARFTPSGQFDHARFEGNVFQRAVNRALTRYRF